MLQADKGAYDSGDRYSQADIQRVISFAEEHGVVVMPEFDTPGHTLSWGKGMWDMSFVIGTT